MADNTFGTLPVPQLPKETLNHNNHPNWKVGDVQIAVLFWNAKAPDDWRQYNNVPNLRKAKEVSLAYEIKRLTVTEIQAPQYVLWPAVGLSFSERAKMAHRFELRDEKGVPWYNDVRAATFPADATEEMFFNDSPEQADGYAKRPDDELDDRPYWLTEGFQSPHMGIDRAVMKFAMNIRTDDDGFFSEDYTAQFGPHAKQFDDLVLELETLSRIHRARRW